jgi:hypothetical protein
VADHRCADHLVSAMRGFTGLAKGEAIERLFYGQVWSPPAG